MRTVLTSALCASVALLFVGCTTGSSDSTPEPVSSATTTNAAPTGTSETTLPVARRRTCPVTLPNGRTPPDGNAAGMNHGIGKTLWTVLWPKGVVTADPSWVEKDGSIGVKWPWWRGLRGTLKIEGRRLDDLGALVRVDVPDGYGLSGFQPSGIYFASEGCWEVTGTVGGGSLTFVTRVVVAMGE
jgi:hypothetical protein